MNKPLRLAVLLAAGTAAIHVLAGGDDVAAPLLATALDPTLKFTLYAVWHMATLSLLMSAGGWLYCLRAPSGPPEKRLLGQFIAMLWIGFGLVFLAVILAFPEHQLLWKLPQWLLLLPTGLLAICGLRGQQPENGC